MSAQPLTQLPVWARVLVGIAYLVGLVTIGAFMVRRARGRDGAVADVARMSWTRACLILFFATSWLFVLSSGISLVISMYSTSWNLCLYTQYTCILLYAVSKAFLYLFLVEKVHVVWTSLDSRGRFKSPVYIACIACTVFYPPYMVGIVGFKGFTAHIATNGRCYIGLKHFISIPIIAYDLWLNVMLTVLFVVPLWRLHIVNLAVKSIAHRSLIASTICLTASTVNILFIYLCHGSQPMWICLSACCLDIAVGATAIFWTTMVREPRAPMSESTKRPASTLVFARSAGGAGVHTAALAELSQVSVVEVEDAFEEGKVTIRGEEDRKVRDEEAVVPVHIVL